MCQPKANVRPKAVSVRKLSTALAFSHDAKMARFLSCVRADDRMGEPSAITVIHSARRKPGTLSFVGG